MSGERRLAGLDGLRGLAALSVVGFHLHATYETFPNLWAKGYLAVDFFMLLSGYVMARTYEGRMLKGLNPKTFLAMRYRRLWPTMAIGSLIGIPYLWSLDSSPPGFFARFVANLFLVPAPLNNELVPLNGPAWTIIFELTANLIHAAVLCRLSNRSLGRLVVVLFGLLALLVLQKGDLDMGAMAPHFLPAIVRSLAAYSLGVLLWRRWQDQPEIAVPAQLSFVALPLLMLAPFAALGWAYDIVFVTVLCPLLIAGGLRLEGAPRWAILSGLLSFPLYAVHGPLLKTAQLAGISPLTAAGSALLAGAMLSMVLSPRPRHATATVTT